MISAGGIPASARSRKWIVAAMAITAALAASAQFVPMIFAASHSRGANDRAAAASGRAQSVPGQPIATSFGPLDAGGEPPSNVLAALEIPAGSEVVERKSFDGNAGSYDRAVTFSSSLGSAEILAFYKGSLARHGWKVSGEFPVPHAPGREVLAQHAGDDGNYWEVGVSTPRPHSFAVRIQLVDNQE